MGGVPSRSSPAVCRLSGSRCQWMALYSQRRRLRVSGVLGHCLLHARAPRERRACVRRQTEIIVVCWHRPMIRIALLALLAFSLPAVAQYPERPVTLLAGYPPGGLVDVVARLVAEGMKAKFPKGIAVVNRPGAAGAVAVAELTRSQPDGYSVVLTPHSALVIAAQMNDLAYKTPDDYDPFINLVAYYPMIAVRTESPDRKSTRLNSSHSSISYAVFCLK